MGFPWDNILWCFSSPPMNPGARTGVLCSKPGDETLWLLRGLFLVVQHKEKISSILVFPGMRSCQARDVPTAAVQECFSIETCRCPWMECPEGLGRMSSAGRALHPPGENSIPCILNLLLLRDSGSSALLSQQLAEIQLCFPGEQPRPSSRPPPPPPPGGSIPWDAHPGS